MCSEGSNPSASAFMCKAGRNPCLFFGIITDENMSETRFEPMKKFHQLLILCMSMILLSGCGMTGVNDAEVIQQVMPKENVSASSEPSVESKQPEVNISQTPVKPDLDPSDQDDVLAKFDVAKNVQQVTEENAEWLSADAFTHGGYVYSTLSDAEKASYRDILYGLENRQYSVVSETDDDAVGRRLEQVMADHPELFYVNGYTGAKVKNNNGHVYYLIQGKYTCTQDEQADIQSKIDAEAGRILSGVPSGDDFTKAEYLVQSIVDNTKADVSDASAKQTIVSVFLQHNSVCAGYSKAFQYLCQKTGIECTEVTGTVTMASYSGVPNHAWNLVKLDGKYYYVDVIWSDPDTAGEASGFDHPWMIYDYMFVTKSDMDLTRATADIFPLPECDSMDDNWFVRNGSFFDSFDESACGSVLTRDASLGRHESSLRFSSSEAYQKAVSVLIDNGKAMKYLGSRKMLYTKNDVMKSIIILF